MIVVNKKSPRRKLVERIKENRRMRPPPREVEAELKVKFSRKIGFLHRVYVSPEGKVYVSTLEPHNKDTDYNVKVFNVDPRTGKQTALVNATVVSIPEKRHIAIHSVWKTNQFLDASLERVRIRSTRGVQAFRPVVETAIQLAREHKMHAVWLICNRVMAKYYEKFGFVRAAPLHSGTRPRRIVGYKMELIV